MKARTLRDLFAGYPGRDTNPSLRDLVAQENLEAEAEFEVSSALPGETHALDTQPNPYISKVGYFELKRLYLSGNLTPQQKKEAYQALVWMAGGPPKFDAPEVPEQGFGMMPGDYEYPGMTPSVVHDEDVDDIDVENFNLEDLWR